MEFSYLALVEIRPASLDTLSGPPMTFFRLNSAATGARLVAVPALYLIGRLIARANVHVPVGNVDLKTVRVANCLRARFSLLLYFFFLTGGEHRSCVVEKLCPLQKYLSKDWD